MLQGFIPGSRAPLAMDLVAAAMVLVLPALCHSISLVKRRRYLAHKRWQIAISAALGVALVVFELAVRIYGWEAAAKPSPHFATWLFPFLYGHLVIAVATTGLWTATLWQALRGFPRPPAPAAVSRWHRRLGKAAAIGVGMTAGTGWIFYWAAFIAS